MGRIRKGILGPVEGTVGPVVGSSWRGIPYIRSEAGKRTGGSSEKQIEQQLKFSVIVYFLQTLAELFEITFKKYAIEQSGFNAAFTYNIKNALGGISPDFEVVYANVLVSRGELFNALAPAATATANVVHYTWTDNSGFGNAGATDKAIFAAYCPSLHQAFYTIGSAVRSDASGTINLSSFAGQEVQTYIAFITEDGNSVSDSFYTGALTL